ncbi:hypothetical protein BO82DRAFT_378488 [Aspergillus uvarum CBS 121591]|uniref:Fungal STAND N-terminal Goodbye domain-containing protein n=1 Tax=Aspergillus uvarum CBS 121591 TaxID=1448315 RepID=A0A319CN62_9EURO|nr:hypothetical protein BO82DRAFT_378488 [Aspergillus uvarum CBS 121591]PYH76908.1 hypothetical protein BO82DRAFT_378488 [Aspergillus uvarum CBS 121591]
MTATSELRDEYNLQEAWEHVCRSFAQTIKADLTTAPKYTIEEDLERSAKYKQGKAVIDKTLAFVKVMDGIVAQGASMVFAPSSLCFNNAIAYLIDTGAMYKRVFSSLAELLRKICDLLDRMQIYMRLQSDAVDVVLRKIPNEQLLLLPSVAMKGSARSWLGWRPSASANPRCAQPWASNRRKQVSGGSKRVQRGPR